MTAFLDLAQHLLTRSFDAAYITPHPNPDSFPSGAGTGLQTYSVLSAEPAPELRRKLLQKLMKRVKIIHSFPMRENPSRFDRSPPSTELASPARLGTISRFRHRAQRGTPAPGRTAGCRRQAANQTRLAPTRRLQDW
jgi:hypothetical protein